MKRVLTATCFAMACAVGLAAQQTTGTTGTTGTMDDQGGQGRGPRTVTGCLRAGDTAGTYMLTDIQMGNRMGTTGTTAGTGTTTTGGGTTATGGGGTTTTAGGATAGDQQPRGQMPTSLMLNPESSVDLKEHVGHKIEVTGTMEGGARRGGDTTTATGGAGTTTTGGGSATSGSAGQTTTGQYGQGQGRGMRTMNVTSVRMISESCS